MNATRSLEDLAALVESLLGEPVPAGFFTDPHIHTAALEPVEHANVSLDDLRE